MNYNWTNSSDDSLRSWVHNGEGGQAGKVAKAVVAGVASTGIVVAETAVNIVKAPFSGVASLLKWAGF